MQSIRQLMKRHFYKSVLYLQQSLETNITHLWTSIVRIRRKSVKSLETKLNKYFMFELNVKISLYFKYQIKYLQDNSQWAL